MAETEGVIKYRLEFELAGAVSENLEHLISWRSILHGLKLIGQTAQRYDGYGYGNLSLRSSNDPTRFIISGSQTGHIANLNQNHFALIRRCDIARNSVTACGPIQPSSEALTHAILYQSDPSIHCVMHVHDPLLWRYGLNNGLPCTAQSIPYGTPEMAVEVSRLLDSGVLRDNGTLVMAGHEDGIICFADSIDLAGQRLLKIWTQAKRYLRQMKRTDQR